MGLRSRNVSYTSLIIIFFQMPFDFLVTSITTRRIHTLFQVGILLKSIPNLNGRRVCMRVNPLQSITIMWIEIDLKCVWEYGLNITVCISPESYFGGKNTIWDSRIMNVCIRLNAPEMQGNQLISRTLLFWRKEDYSHFLLNSTTQEQVCCFLSKKKNNWF